MKKIMLMVFCALFLTGCGDSSPNKKKTEGDPKQAVSTEQPQKGTVSFPQTPQEKKYLDGDVEFTFYRSILAQNPDIKKLKLHIPKDEDKLSAKTMDESFRVAMYFSKQIVLADGQTLFHFLTTCAKNQPDFAIAQLGYDDKTKEKFIHIQYHPIVRRSDGSEFEMRLVYDRFGEKVTAFRTGYPSDLLTDSGFMSKHGFRCW